MTTNTSYAGPERRRAKPSKSEVGLALLSAAAIAFVTLCPIGLRPHLGNPDVERIAAFAVLGVLVSQAAGRRGIGATVIVMALAFGLEAGQVIAPGRHAHVADALVKAFGGVTGVAMAQLSFPLRRLLVRLSGLADSKWVTAPIYVTSR